MKVKVNENIFNVKTLIDEHSQRVGMTGKEFDETFDGLLFLMGGNKQCFWMLDCITNLDIIIIKNNVIVNIHHNCPPCDDEYDCYWSNHPPISCYKLPCLHGFVELPGNSILAD